MKRSEMMKALRELAGGDGDEDEKKAAGELYKSMGGEDGEKKAAESETESEKKAAEEDEPPPSSKKEEPRTAKRAVKTAPVDLALRVATLESNEQRRAVETLVNKHADRFTPTTRAWALGEPIDVVERYLKQAPKVNLRAPAPTTPPTRGEAQGEGKPSADIPAEDASQLDRILGIMPESTEAGFGRFDATRGTKPFRTLGGPQITAIQNERRAPRKAG